MPETCFPIRKKLQLLISSPGAMLLLACMTLGGCSGGDFGRTRQDVLSDDMHRWIGGEATASVGLRASQFQLTDNERQLRDLAYPLIEPPHSRPAWKSVFGDYQPLRRDRRRALEAVRTGDGRALGANMKAQIGRELDRLELLLDQIATIEAERDAMLARQAEAEAAPGVQSARSAPARVQKLMELNGLGAETVAMLETEAFYRSFDNRRQLAAFGGLAGTRGRAARSITNRASRWAIPACARR